MKKRIAKTLKEMADNLEGMSQGKIPQPETEVGRAFAAVVMHRTTKKMKGFQKTTGKKNGGGSVYRIGAHRFYEELKVMHKQGLVRV